MSSVRITRLSVAEAPTSSKLRITALAVDSVTVGSKLRISKLEVQALGVASKLRITQLSVAGAGALPVTKWIRVAGALVPLRRSTGAVEPPPPTWGPYGNLGAYQPWWNTSGAPATLNWTPPSGGGMGDYTPTGYPDTGLSPLIGDQVITTPGTIIEDREIFGILDVRTTDVIIRRCVIHGPQTAGQSASTVGLVRFEHTAVQRALIEDCTIFPNVPYWDMDGVRGHDFTARRCSIFGVADGFGIMNTSAPSSAYNVAIEGCFIWGLGYRAAPTSRITEGHTLNDGIHVHGGNTIRIEGNNIQAFCAPAFSDLPIPNAADTAALPFVGWGQTTARTVALLPIISQISGVQVTNNWLSGGSEGNIYSDLRTYPAPSSLGAWSGNKFDGTGHSPERYTIRLQVSALTYTGSNNTYQNAKFGQANGLPVTTRYDDVVDPTTPWPYGDLGTYKPSAGTTGVRAGVVLTPLVGNQTITVPNTIIQNRDITGRILVQTTGVIIRNCRIRGSGAPPGTTTPIGLVSFEHNAVRNGLIEDCTLLPDVSSDLWDGIRGHHFTARRCDISGSTDGIGVMNTSAAYSDYNVHIEGNFIHDLGYRLTATQPDGKTHNDGIQIHGGDNIWVVGNTIYANSNTAYSDSVNPYYPAVPGQCILFAAIIGGRITNGHFTDNWFDYGTVQMNNDYRNDNVTGPFGEVKRNKHGRNNHAIGGVKQAVKVCKEQTTADIPLTGPDANVFEDTGLPVTVLRP